MSIFIQYNTQFQTVSIRSQMNIQPKTEKKTRSKRHIDIYRQHIVKAHQCFCACEILFIEMPNFQTKEKPKYKTK